MVFTGIIIFAIILLGAYFFFQPLYIKVPGRDDHHPSREFHESEDIKIFLHGDKLDVSAHYHNSHEDKLM
jgi:hypothetical protein